MLARKLALANLIANVGIVITGGAVRLTGSGMACPTWPECVEGSYVPTSAAPQNVGIEFGNRLLSVIVGLIAVATVLALWRRPQRKLALWVLGGVLFQGVLGGLTVRFHLSPYFVGPHFLISMALIALAYQLWRQTVGSATSTESRLRPLSWVLTAVSGLVIVIGVVVTGSGPHSGDAEAVRTGLDPETISQLHVDAVFLLLGLTIAMWFAARALQASAVARASLILFGVSLAQGGIGFVQYFTGLPWVLVGFHLAGACAVWVATLALHRTTAGAATPVATAPADDERKALVTV